MSSRSHERRTERATAEEVAEVERQLWEFAKRIDPPSVPEAKLRPGAFLWRVHRTWHSLGRGTGGLASRSFRALRDELLRRDPPVRNLQPKLYGNTALAHAEAEQLIDVILETWHLERERGGKWQAGPLAYPDGLKSADRQDLEAIRENLVHTLYRGDEGILIEEPVGVPPEIFFEQRGRSSLALIIPTKGETMAHLSPSNLYGGFSNLVGRFFDAASERRGKGQTMPLLIWVLRLRASRDNSVFHVAFHSLVAYSACLSNWYFRLRQKPPSSQMTTSEYWEMILKNSAFAVHGLPNDNKDIIKGKYFDENLAGIEPDFFLPNSLPAELNNHHLIRRHRNQDFGLNVSIEPNNIDSNMENNNLNYWLFPDRPREDLEETADTTGLPVFNAEISPGRDFDDAFTALYQATNFYLGYADNERSKVSYETLLTIGWKFLNIKEFQKHLLVGEVI